MNGNLIIAGGNLGPSRPKIFKTFMNLMPKGRGKILIIVVSSSIPVESYQDTKDTFVSLGVEESDISCLPLTYEKELLKEGWTDQINQLDEEDYLKDCGGVWFVGGDQVKISQGFLIGFNLDTRFLRKIKHLLEEEGIVVGGTSAGAAAMGDYVIGSGTDDGALNFPIAVDPINYEVSKLDEIGQLLITKGLGFFDNFIIDQHFDKRSRLQRLILSMKFTKAKYGYGISEDTAIVYHRKDNTFRVIGSAYVMKVENKEDEVVLKYLTEEANGIAKTH